MRERRMLHLKMFLANKVSFSECEMMIWDILTWMMTMPVILTIIVMIMMMTMITTMPTIMTMTLPMILTLTASLRCVSCENRVEQLEELY